MKYDLSEKILEKIKLSENILINCHRSPDPDGIGSALALFEIVRNLGKNVKVISPDNLSKEHLFHPFSETVEKVDFNLFNFSGWDLFLTVDSGSWGMVSGDKNIKFPDIFKIVIDHHITNEKYGDINLIDFNTSSNCEIVYEVIKDWGYNLTKTVSQNLLSGIICDTGVFQYPNVSSRTLEIVKELMDKGADKDEIIFNIYRSYSFDKLKIWGKILEYMQIDESNKFIWSAIPYEVYEKYNKPENAKETASSFFTPVVDKTNFGLVMIEEEKNVLSISFRSRKDFDVSVIAKELDGGGHKSASGAKVKGVEYDKAVKMVLDACRKHA